MAKQSQVVQIGKHKVELTNLNKFLYPEDEVVKAEVIQYYLKIAPTILNHIKGRPLTLIRFPDGIHGETFYQKNRPKWAPDWIEHVQLGKEKKLDFILASNEATMVWLANLACLELHQLHSRKPHYDNPDYFVFDLDPPEGYYFPKLVEIAFDLREHIEGYGYHTFVKTTGGKGVHIVVPIEPRWDFHQAFEAAQGVARPFVDDYPKTTTLHIKKEARKGRVLIDIYRNRGGQSIISPYSLRGRVGAPVAMPLNWDELAEVKDPKEFDIRTAIEHVLTHGDAWEGMAAYATGLHTQEKITPRKEELPPGDHYKSPEKLESYDAKRDFNKTPEPGAEVVLGDGNGFVIHRHHASRLHYDLRLEEDGVLKSWAVPRGLPPRPGVKRLAVATEDHPLEYLTFEGKIPKGQYGGGSMWRYALGKYEITKKKQNGFYFFLHSKEVDAEYRIHLMKEREWLLERVNNPQIDWVKENVQPMLADSAKQPPVGDQYLYEVKWDGIRAMIYMEEGELRIMSRNPRDITRQFPELNIPERAFRATTAVFDAEIVCLDAAGKPNFKTVIKRLLRTNEGDIERQSKKHPVYCYLFDCLYLDGRPIINEPLTRRREWLADVIRRDTPYRLSETVEDGEALFEAAKKLGVEGIMAKDKYSRYLPGRRSSNWVKVKVRNTAEAYIVGATEGKGDREPYFGALHLAEREGDELIYRGKVGTGFDEATLKSVHEELKKLEVRDRPFETRPLDDAKSVYYAPHLLAEIEYASFTDNMTYREPVFVRLRPDLME